MKSIKITSICSNESLTVESPSNRFIASLYRVSATTAVADEETRTELDSHADTSCGGSNTVLLGPTQQTVKVSAFAPGYGSKEYPIGTVGTVWTDPLSGVSYLLIIHQAIYLGNELKHSLLNPNQMRANGLQVDECPKQFDETSTHSNISDDPKISIPMSLARVISYFYSRKPTQDDLENLEQIVLTGTA